MNVEVIVDGLDKNPQCFHGPSLLFKRNGNKSKKYYACSACRDHKECPFYIETSDKRLKNFKNLSKWIDIRAETINGILAKNPYKKYLKLLKLVKSTNSCDKTKHCQIFSKTPDNKHEIKRKKKLKLSVDESEKVSNKTEETTASYCYTCEELFENSGCDEHSQCKVLKNITEYQLKHPTEILIPKEDSKTHAQFFFSQDTVKNIVLLLSRFKSERVLCIGAPRIHEHLMNECKGQIQSILLDIDLKYYNFYNDKQFIWYNMFNNFVLKEDCSKILKEFLRSKNVMVLMDPPFGGRVEPLAYTLNELTKMHSQVNGLQDNKCESGLRVIMIFPYFMESHVKTSLPDFNMSDLKIDYENHSSFTNVGARKRKFGSPVRIFTNVPLRLLDLDGVDGYKYCDECGFWVSEENRHCRECSACTSKNGRTYKHCWGCMRCVKPSYEHCRSCRRCHLPDGVCGKGVAGNCFHCKEPGHKKRDCPNADGGKRQNGKRKKLKASS